MNAPVFTIHDAILTSGLYINDLEELLKKRLFEVTGIQPGADVTEFKKNTEPDPIDIQKAWSKIRPINSKKSYEKAKHKIFDSHVQMGRKFLEDKGLTNLL